MSATIGAALKKLAVALAMDKRNWDKIVCLLLAIAIFVLALSGCAHEPGFVETLVAEAGCGCSPVTHGRKEFGQFLESGECAQFERRDFLGVQKKKHLPPGAGSGLAEIEIQDNLLTGKLLL